MSTLITSKFCSLKLNTKEIFAEIDKTEEDRLREVGRYVSKIMRKNANKDGDSNPGGFPAKREGHLKKSLGYRLNKQDKTIKVGSKSGKIHLTEYGHGDGKTKNRRPLIWPSLKEAEPGVEKILSRPYFS